MDLDVPIDIAILGGSMRIPTIDGDVDLSIPAGTQPEQRKILRGRGVKRLRGSRGDQVVTIKVKIPTGLTDVQKDLLRRAFGKEQQVPRAETTKPSDPEEKKESDGSFVKFFKNLAEKKKKKLE
jgi:molecular chaperone DnaJ